jgi:membrane-bound serine protease (ClpP class)
VTVPIVLTLIGFVFVVGEIFFVSMGLFGIAAIACLILADVMAAQQSQTLLWVLVGVQIVGVPLVVKGALAVLPRLPFGRGMMLAAPASESRSGVEPGAHLLGKEGVALTDLRPGGTASFGDERRSVVAETGSIDRGTPLVVVSVEGYRVVVRPPAARGK